MRPKTVPPPALRASFTAGDGLVRRSDLRRLGIPRSTVDRWLDMGLLVPIANGVYADPAVIKGLHPWPLFRMRSRAFLMAGPPNAYAADWSAIALHDLPVLDDPPTVPSVIRPGSRRSGSNRTVNGRTRFAAVPDRWLSEVDGIPSVKPAFAAVDVARRAGRLASLMVVDAVAARHEGRDQLTGALSDIEGWSGAGRAGWAVRNCDPDVESPLESAGRLAFIAAGLPPSRTNEWVGEFLPVFRLDHYWPEQRVGAEADGIDKYLGNPAAAIRAEKDREWRLQRMGIRVIRYGWKVARGSPDVLAGRVRELLDAPPLPPGRLCTWSNSEGRALRGLGRTAPTGHTAWPR